MSNARGTIVLACMAAAWGCNGSGPSHATMVRASAELAEAAAAVTGERAVAAEAVSTGHLGFDTSDYPGDDAMLAWRKGGAPYEWTGFYLLSPCHADNSWSGRRDTLTSMGYGLAVVYVGQQTWGRMPGAPHFISSRVSARVAKRVGHGDSRRTVWQRVTRTILHQAPPPDANAKCNADFVDAAHGVADGTDAVTRAQKEGFARSTAIFLDLERMEYVPPAMREYYKAWVRTVLADGRYRPGIYVHTFNANGVYDDVKDVYRGAGATTEPPFWVANARGFDISKLPSEVGHAFAAVWQGILDVKQTWNGHRIPIDVNVSNRKSPSN